jgi:CheY-like chemotaxis protein
LNQELPLSAQPSDLALGGFWRGLQRFRWPDRFAIELGESHDQSGVRFLTAWLPRRRLIRSFGVWLSHNRDFFLRYAGDELNECLADARSRSIRKNPIRLSEKTRPRPVLASKRNQTAQRSTPFMCAILLVEDHYDTQQAFAAVLRSWGHEVGTGDSTESGLRFLDDNAVDVVLSDIGLPDRNGYDFIAEARERLPGLRTIAVSAYFTAADQQRGNDAGFDMFFAKPVDLAALRMVLERIDSPAGRKGNGAS